MRRVALFLTGAVVGLVVGAGVLFVLWWGVALVHGLLDAPRY